MSVLPRVGGRAIQVKLIGVVRIRVCGCGCAGRERVGHSVTEGRVWMRPRELHAQATLQAPTEPLC